MTKRETNPLHDFFVSYDSADKSWAEWIAWILEANNYTVKIQDWNVLIQDDNLLPDNNVELATDKVARDCLHTIAVLSDNYLQAQDADPEWAAAFKQNFDSQSSTLILIRVGDCKPDGWPGPLNYIDIVGKEEAEAENSILEGIAAALKRQGSPNNRPAFPHSTNGNLQLPEEDITCSDGESPIDRLNLFDMLSALTAQEFEKVIFALQPPAGIVPGQAAPQGNRVSALLEWLESPSGSGLEILQTLLNNIFQAKGRQVPDKKAFPGPGKTLNPFLPLTGAVEDPDLFFNCDHILDRIFEVLNSGSSVALIGERNMGKSSILRAVHRQATERLQPKRQSVLLNLTRIYSEEDFYSAFCEKIGLQPCYGRELDKALNQKRLLLVLDEVERISQEEFTRRVREQLRGLAEDQDAPLKLVVAARTSLERLFPDGYDEGMVSPLEGICLEENLQPWSPETIQQFIETRLAETPIRFTDAEIAQLIADSAGKPKQLMQLCNVLYREKLQ